MSIIKGPVLLVGCGKMGGAMLRGWLAQGLAASDAFAIDPQTACHAEFGPAGVTMCTGPDGLPHDLEPRTLILAVKPQMMPDVLPHLRTLIGPDTLVISIAAGTMIATIQSAFEPTTAIVRVMPNTPAAIGKGVSVLCANAHARPTHRHEAEKLSAAVGSVNWIDDEDQMHAVTGLSGSGPAYVFHLIEAMTEAGLKAGLSRELSAQLARDTIAGAGALARETGDDPAQLRINVTSPGGTTQAGLVSLMDEQQGLTQLMVRTVDAAARRSRELAAS